MNASKAELREYLASNIACEIVCSGDEKHRIALEKLKRLSGGTFMSAAKEHVFGRSLGRKTVAEQNYSPDIIISFADSGYKVIGDLSFGKAKIYFSSGQTLKFSK